MDRRKKPGKWTKHWYSVVLAWVNSLQEVSCTFSRVTHVFNSDFIEDLIKQIFSHDGRDIPSYKHSEELIDKFIKEYFPESHSEKHLRLENEEDQVILLSLLMYAACIKCQIQDILNKNCKFIDASNQEILASFFQQMISIGEGKYTQLNIVEALRQSFGTWVVNPSSPLSPATSSSCLKQLFDSPTLQDLKNRDKENKRLKSLLEEEINEKDDLWRKNHCLKEEIKRLQVALSDKIKENKELKEDLNQSIAPSSPVVLDINETSQSKLIKELKTELTEVRQENEILFSHQTQLQNKITILNDRLEDQETVLVQKSQEFEEVYSKCIASDYENEKLKTKVKELSQIVEELKEKNMPCEVFDMSGPIDEQNLAQTVIDPQLLEKQENIEQLQKQLSSFQEKYEGIVKEKEFKYATVEQILIENEVTIKGLKQEIKQQTVSVKILEQSCYELYEKLQHVNHKNNELGLTRLTKKTQIVNEEKNNIHVTHDSFNQRGDISLNDCSELTKLDVKSNPITAVEKATHIGVTTGENKKIPRERTIFKQGIQFLGFLISALNCHRPGESEEFFVHIKASQNEQPLLSLSNNHHSKHFTRQFGQNIGNEEYNNEDGYNHKFILELKRSTLEIAKRYSLEEEITKDILVLIEDKDILVKELETVKNHFEDEILSKKAEIKAVTETCNKKDELLCASQADLVSLKEDNKSLMDRTNKLQSELTVSTGETLLLTEQVAALNKSVGDLKSVVLDKDCQMDKLKAFIQTLNAQKQEMQDGLEKKLNVSRADFENKLVLKESKNKELTDSCSKINKQLSSTQAELVSLIDVNKSLLATNDQLELELTMRTGENVKLKEQLASVLNTVEELNSKVCDKEAQVGKLTHTLETEKHKLQSTVESQTGLINKLEVIRNELANKLVSKESENKELNESRGKLNKRLSATQAELTSLTDVNQNLLATNNKLESELSVKTGETIELKKELASVYNNVKELNSNVRDKEAQLAELTQTLDTDKQRFQSTIESQTELINKLEVIRNELANKLLSKESENKELNESCGKLNERLSATQAELMSLTDVNQNLLATNDKLESELSVKTVETIELKKELASVYNNVKELNSNVRDKEAQLAELTQSLDTDKQRFQSTIESQTELINKLEVIRNKLANKLLSKESENKELNESCGKLNERLSATQAELMSLTDVNQNLLATNDKLESEMSVKTGETIELKKELASVYNNVKELNSNFRDKEAQLAELTQTLDTDKQRFQSTIESQTGLINKLEVIRNELANKLLSKESENKELIESCDKLNERLSATQAELTSLTDVNQNLLATNYKLESELSVKTVETIELKKELASVYNNVKELNSNIRDKEAQLAELTQTLDTDKQRFQSIIESQTGLINKLEVIRNELANKLLSKESENKELIESCDKLNERLSATQAELTSLTDVNQNLLATNYKLESELSVKTVETIELKKELASVYNNVKELNSNIRDKEAQLAELTQTLDTDKQRFQSIIESQTGLINKLEVIRNELANKLLSKESENKELIESCDKLNERLSATQAELTSLTDVNQNLLATNYKLESELSVKTVETIELKKELASVYNNVKELNSNIRDKEAQLAELTQTLDTDKQRFQSIIESQTGLINKLEVIRNELANKLLSKESENKELIESCDKLNERLSATQAELTSLTDVNQNLLATNYKLESELSVKTVETIELKKELASVYNNVKELNSNIRDKEAQLAELTQTLDTDKQRFQSIIESQTGVINKLEVIRNEVTNRLVSKESENKELIESCDKLNERLSATQAELTSLTDVNQNLLATNDKLESELSVKTVETIELKKELASVYNNVKELNSDVRDKEAQLAELTQTLDTDKQSFQSTIESQASLIKELEISKVVFEDSLKTKESEVKVLTETSSKLKEELADLVSTIENLNHEVQDKETQLTEMTCFTQSLESQKQDLQIQFESQANVIEELEISKMEVEENLHTKQSEVEALTQACSKLEEQLFTSQAELVSLKDINQRLLATNDKLESELSERNGETVQLKEQLASLTNTVEVLKIEVCDKEIQLAALTQTLDTQKQKLESQANVIEELEISKIEVEENLHTKQSEVEALTQACSKLEEQLFTSQAELVSLKDINQRLLATNDKLESELSERNGETVQLKEQLASLTNTVEVLKIEVCDKEIQLAALTQTLDTQKQKLESQASLIEELEISKVVFEDSLKTKESEVEVLTETSSKLKEQLADLVSTIENLNHEVQDKETQLTEMTCFTQSLESQKQVLQIQFESQITSVTAETMQLKEEVEKKSSCILVLEQNCSELTTENANLAQRLLNLESDYKLVCDKNLELTSQLSSVTAGAKHLENIAQEDDFKINLLESTITKHESTVQDQIHLIKSLKEEITSLQGSVEKINHSNVEKDSSIAQLNCEYKLLKNDFDEMASQLNIKNKQVMSLKHSLTLEAEKLSQLKSDLVSVQEDVKQKSQKISEYEGLVNQLNKTSEQAEWDFSQRASLLQERNSELEKLVELKERTAQSLNAEVDSLKKQLVTYDPQLKEAYDTLFDDYHRSKDERQELQSQYDSLKEANNKVRAEFEGKLKFLKAEMKNACTRAMQQKEAECDRKIEQYKLSIKSLQEHISQLGSQLWDTSDKLITNKNENKGLKEELKRALSHQNNAVLMQRAQSHNQLNYAAPELRQDIDESFTVIRRHSVRTVPSGMGIKLLPSGKVFPSEDEVDEVFTNECLADLKAGRCQVTVDPDRVSTLKYRNSLCPPHLKSSYPAELQFIPVDTIREDEIKGRGGDCEDTKSLLSERQRRRDRSQTSYKKPGPPTPSKHGSRVTSQTLELKQMATPRTALREVNDGGKKPGTPSRLFSQFFTSKTKDENTPTTPNQRRLSFFNKRFGKREPM